MSFGSGDDGAGIMVRSAYGLLRDPARGSPLTVARGDPGHQRLRIGGHLFGRVASEVAKRFEVHCVHPHKHIRSGVQSGGDHGAKAASARLLFAELVDDQQIDPVSQSAFGGGDSRFQTFSVEAAAARFASQRLADPDHWSVRQDNRVHIAPRAARSVGIYLHDSRQTQPARPGLRGDLVEERVKFPAPLGHGVGEAHSRSSHGRGHGARLDGAARARDVWHMSEEFPRIEPLGEAALLVRFAPQLDDAANRACVAFRAGLEAEPLPGVIETASSLGSVLVRHDGRDVTEALKARLDACDWARVSPPPRRRWSIPCSYGGDDGPQLGEAASMAGLSQADAVAALSKARVRVLALGFAPGMPYLGILPECWDLPRQTGLTPKVPEGALVVAVRQFVLFGTEAPTGWRQVGRTAFGCFEPTRLRPIALSPGDEVTFPSVSEAELHERADADTARHGGATWEEIA